MNKTQRIDFLFNYINENNPFNVDDICKQMGCERSSLESLITELHRSSYIQHSSHLDGYVITENGREVLRTGGWDSYIKLRNFISQNDVERKAAEVYKLQWEGKLAKWQSKSFWWVFAGGVIGGIMGAISLFLELQGRYYKPAVQQQTETTANTTSILPQTKRGDSVAITKE